MHPRNAPICVAFLAPHQFTTHSLSLPLHAHLTGGADVLAADPDTRLQKEKLEKGGSLVGSIAWRATRM